MQFRHEVELNSQPCLSIKTGCLIETNVNKMFMIRWIRRRRSRLAGRAVGREMQGGLEATSSWARALTTQLALIVAVALLQLPKLFLAVLAVANIDKNKKRRQDEEGATRAIQFLDVYT